MSEDDKPTLELLKLHIGRNRDGAWAILAMKGITLRPRGGQTESFFPIHDDVVVLQSASIGTTTFLLGQSIVPLVAQVPGERVLRCLGTGFFISCSGLLITAAHVITDPIERKYGGVKELDNQTWHLGGLKLGVMIPLNPILWRA
jgi:S1-C subfamily serine protease